MPAVPFCRVTLLLTLALMGAKGCDRRSGETPIVLSGNIEVTDAQLGFKVPGRIAERRVSEGDQVAIGDVLARLEPEEQREELALRRAELAAAEAVLAELLAGSREQEIAAAAAALARAEAERERAQVDLRRQEELASQQVISQRDLELVQTEARVAEAQARVAAEQWQLLRAGPRPEVIEQARARTAQARAGVALAEARLGYTELMSSLDGVVLAHHAEPGEIVAAGTPVVTVGDLARPWVRTFVNQVDLGHLRHGQSVDIRIDTFPDRVFTGTIGFIAAEAEFTPKSVQTEKERVRLVYRLKVYVDNPEGLLKPGMPADVIVPRPTE